MKEDLKTSFDPKKKRHATQGSLGRFFVISLWVLLGACDPPKDILNAPEYEGPLSSLDSAKTLVSDSGRVVMEMKFPQQNNFENGDQEWPQGFAVEWYNKKGEVTGFFSANYVYFTKDKSLYHATGNVIVQSYVKNDRLNTEELFWDQLDKKFYTEKFVTIESDDEVHTGEGMEANEDFTEYRILKPNGTFSLEDDPNRPQERDVVLTPIKKNETP